MKLPRGDHAEVTPIPPSMSEETVIPDLLDISEDNADGDTSNDTVIRFSSLNKKKSVDIAPVARRTRSRPEKEGTIKNKVQNLY